MTKATIINSPADKIQVENGMTPNPKVAILAGGRGTRMLENTNQLPKALTPIASKPILWHIMCYYSSFGFSSFIIALGHQGDLLRDYFTNSCNLDSCIAQKAWHKESEGPELSPILVDTGAYTLTGGRIKRLEPYLGDQTFMLTWCDGLADVDLTGLLKFHQSHGKLATLTVVRPPERFGCVELRGDQVINFHEKPMVYDRWINGAYFVLDPGVFKYIKGDETAWEKDPLERLAADGQLMAFRHHGFWQCMDTPYERRLLEDMWHSGQAPWKKWD